jgi:hypothetical protein
VDTCFHICASIVCVRVRQASRWTYSSDTALSPDRKIRANVVQRYHFSSNLRRMTATVEVRASCATLHVCFEPQDSAFFLLRQWGWRTLCMHS